MEMKPKCPACGGNYFEFVTYTFPSEGSGPGSVGLLCCSTCGAVLTYNGRRDHEVKVLLDIHESIEALQKEMRDIRKEIANQQRD
jgi:hypothetical protein